MYRFSSPAKVISRVLAVVVLFAASQTAWSQGQQKTQGIENFGEVSNLLYRGAQPSAVGFKTLHNMGVEIVVNFRYEADETASEKRQVESLGMKYVGIPWSALRNPRDAQVVQFLDLVRANPQAKIFVHCRRGADRTGTMVAAYRVAIEHEQPNEAVSEMYRYHYAHFLLPHLQRYITSLPQTLQTDTVYSAYAAKTAASSAGSSAPTASTAILGAPALAIQ